MEIPDNILALSVLTAIWTLPWKGLSLWKAAKNNHKGWFVALMVINTLAVLEIIYLFAVKPRVKISFIWKKDSS